MVPRPQPQQYRNNSSPLFDDDAWSSRPSRSLGVADRDSAEGLELSPVRRGSRPSLKSSSSSSCCGETWQDEGLVDGSCRREEEADPLLASPAGGLFSLDQQLAQQDEACQNDGALAAMLAREWGSLLTAKKKKHPLYREHPATFQENVCGGLFLAAFLAGLVVLAMLAIAAGSTGSSRHSYTCSGDWEDWTQLVEDVRAANLTATGRCRVPEETNEVCLCQNPLAVPIDPTSMDEDTPAVIPFNNRRNSTHRHEENNTVVLWGLDRRIRNSWNAELTNSTHQESQLTGGLLVSRAEETLAQQLYPLEQLVESSAGPLVAYEDRLSTTRVWWMSLGTRDLFVDRCSPEVVLAGTFQMVQDLMALAEQFLPRDGVVVLSALDVLNAEAGTTDDADIDGLESATKREWARDFHERLACLADSFNQRNALWKVQVFPPLIETALAEDDDDDFFLDVTSATSTEASPRNILTPQEQTRAILDEIESLLSLR